MAYKISKSKERKNKTYLENQELGTLKLLAYGNIKVDENKRKSAKKYLQKHFTKEANDEWKKDKGVRQGSNYWGWGKLRKKYGEQFNIK